MYFGGLLEPQARFQEQRGNFVGELVLPYCDRSDWEIHLIISEAHRERIKSI